MVAHSAGAVSGPAAYLALRHGSYPPTRLFSLGRQTDPTPPRVVPRLPPASRRQDPSASGRFFRTPDTRRTRRITVTTRWLKRFLMNFDRARRTNRARQNPVGEEKTRLVDAFIDAYVAWREQCVEVQTAYDRWIEARDPRGSAFSIYYAELDSEERAARTYRDSAERLAAAAATWQHERFTAPPDTATGG
jgi:hypothetical protein